MLDGTKAGREAEQAVQGRWPDVLVCEPIHHGARYGSGEGQLGVSATLHYKAEMNVMVMLNMTFCWNAVTIIYWPLDS